jgi:hypothetical protein
MSGVVIGGRCKLRAVAWGRQSPHLRKGPDHAKFRCKPTANTGKRDTSTIITFAHPEWPPSQTVESTYLLRQRYCQSASILRGGGTQRNEGLRSSHVESFPSGNI